MYAGETVRLPGLLLATHTEDVRDEGTLSGSDSPLPQRRRVRLCTVTKDLVGFPGLRELEKEILNASHLVEEYLPSVERERRTCHRLIYGACKDPVIHYE